MDYNIIKMKKIHKSEVIELWKNRMGRKYPDESKIDKAINNLDEYFGFVTISSDENIIGFSIGSIITQEEAQNKVPSVNLFSESVQKVGFFDLNVVKESIEDNGVGTSQIRKRKRYYQQNGINNLLAICWIRDNHRDSASLLEQEGFDCICKIPNFWYEDTIKRDAVCIDCDDPCTCTAGIYISNINV